MHYLLYAGSGPSPRKLSWRNNLLGVSHSNSRERSLQTGTGLVHTIVGCALFIFQVWGLQPLWFHHVLFKKLNYLLWISCPGTSLLIVLPYRRIPDFIHSYISPAQTKCNYAYSVLGWSPWKLEITIVDISDLHLVKSENVLHPLKRCKVFPEWRPMPSEQSPVFSRQPLRMGPKS